MISDDELNRIFREALGEYLDSPRGRRLIRSAIETPARQPAGVTFQAIRRSGDSRHRR